jgi:hypothetical protein
MVCDHDPRVSEFYALRRALEKETVKLKGKGIERAGMDVDKKRKVVEKVAGIRRSLSISGSGSSSSPAATLSTSAPSLPTLEERPKKRLRKSADRELAKLAGGVTPMLPKRTLRKR